MANNEVQVEIDLEDSERPIYAQIVERVKHLVATGEAHPGQLMPTVRKLAAQLSVNPNTIARAYTILDAQGVISTQRGRGTFIREHQDDEALRELRQEKLHTILSAALLEALSLGYLLDEIEVVLYKEIERWRRRQQ